MSGTKRLAIVAFAVVALLTMVGLAGAGSYTTGFESFNLGTVDGQDGWHSAVPGDIPALPDGYDQAVVNTSSFGSPSGFDTKALRVSNAYSEPTAEFEFQTYSPSVADPAGETQTNKVFDGTFQFISTSANFQPGLNVSVSPDNGHGGRMSYLGLKDTLNGIQATFYDVAPDGTFRPYVVPYLLARDQVHTVEFLIETVPGAPGDVLDGTDVVRLIIDDVDIGDLLNACFTTWEQYYRVGEKHDPGVIDSFEFRSSNTSNYGNCDANGATQNAAGTCVVPGLFGGGYLFDNVSTVTSTTGGPAPTTCGNVGQIAPTQTTCQQYRDGTAPTLEQLQYTTKGTKINAVSPGVFFYYTKVSATSGDTVDITQDNDAVSAPDIPINNGQVVLYNASTCNVLKWTDLDVNPNGTTTGTLPADGDFIIGTKYNPSALKGKPIPNPTTVTYTFGMDLNDVTKDFATIDLVPKT